MPRTRIVCTLGPATSSEECLRALIRAGMNVARFNFSHGTHDEHAQRIELVRRIAAEEKKVVALLGDLQGPKIRIGDIPGGVLSLQTGETLRLVFGPETPPKGRESAVSIDLPFLSSVLQIGHQILMDDGNIELAVAEMGPDYAVTRVVNGGELRPHKGVNLPGIDLPIPSITAKDRVDLEWIIAHDFDYVALSFVRRAADIQLLQDLLRERNAWIPIIAKIEMAQALQEIDAILETTDGVMVARGDLGVEIPAEQVPIYQKRIISKANALGKPVITATQMLESMTHNPRPTRAEASDVANAILDGSDAVMLSGETSIGEFPIAAVRAMARIAEFTEQKLPEYFRTCRPIAGGRVSISDAIGQATCEIAEEVGAQLIITLTSSGYSARMVARHRPVTPILGVTPSERTQRRLALAWGVDTALIPEDGETEQAVRAALEVARAGGWAHPHDRVIVTAGVPTGIGGRTNMVQVREIE